MLQILITIQVLSTKYDLLYKPPMLRSSNRNPTSLIFLPHLSWDRGKYHVYSNLSKEVHIIKQYM